jgi:hypothetical protein
MRDDVIIKVVAIVALTVINVTALMNGIDTILTSTVCAIIGGIAGYSVKVSTTRRKRPK